MTQPRIAWLLTSAFFYWQPLMQSVTKRFPQTRVFTSRWHGFAPGLEGSFDLEQVGQRKIIKLSEANTSYGNNFTYLPLNIVNRLWRFKPDVIFSNAFGVWTILALLFQYLGDWKVVIAYEGSSPGVDYRNAPLRLALRRLMVRVAAACITNSQAGKHYLIDCLNANKERVFTQPYEVPGDASLSENIADQTMANLGLESDQVQRPVFLFVGSTIPRKGIQLLLQACVHLQTQGQSNYTLLIVGDGEQKTELEQFSQDHQLTDSVKWVGRVDYQQVGAYFQQADVFVLPTLEDTWGMVVLEAMAVGTPVLCSQLAGACELVTDGQNGYSFDPHNTAQLAAAMTRFIDNPELAKTLGRTAQQTMNQCYSPEVAADFLADVTSVVLSSKTIQEAT